MARVRASSSVLTATLLQRADTGGSADDERGFALTPLARADASPVERHQPRLSNGTPLSRPGSPLSLDPVHLSPKAQRVSPGHSRRLIEGWPRIEQHLEPLRALPADTGSFRTTSSDLLPAEQRSV